MTTGYPILEQIAQAIQASLEEVTTDNDYQQTINVVRADMLGKNWTPTNLTCLLEIGEPERNEEYEYHAHPHINGWDQPFVIKLWTRLSETDPTPMQQAAAVVKADIIVALTDTDNGWETWGNIAMFSDVSDWRDTQADDGSIVSELTVTVAYRTPFNDPYTAA